MENKHPSSSNEKQVISQQSDLTDVLIFDEILTRLPVKSILRFKSVSKQWYSTLSSSNFANTHLKKSPFSHPCAPVNTLIIQSGSNCYILSYDDEEVDLISHNFEDKNLVKLNTEFLVEKDDGLFLAESCNGLICITANNGKYFILWNPATRKLNMYDTPDEYLNRFEKVFRNTCGFGYVSSVEDYKFVAILTVYQGNSESSMFALIFSLGENRWRKIDLDDNTLYFSYDAGVHVSEKLYWRASSDQAEKKLVSFDLAAERFDVIDVDWDKYETLGVSKGCLHKLNWKNTFKVDILEPPAIVKSIELPEELLLERYSRIIGFTKTDKLFVTESLSNKSSNFFIRVLSVRTLGIVDTCTRPMQHTRILNFGEVPYSIARYVPSLVSPFPSEHS